MSLEMAPFDRSRKSSY